MLACLAAVVLFLILGDDLAAQCAMCKETVDSDKASGGNLADGISGSILFMLALPVTVLGGFSLALWRAYRNAPPQD